MSDISVLGLGQMGSAMAHALLANGRKVTVWNRAPEKAQPFIDSGAEIAASADRPFGVVEPLYGVAAVAIKSRRSGLGGAGENGQGAGDT